MMPRHSFAAMGFDDPVEATVVLLGGHNIGRSRVTRAPNCSRGLVSSYAITMLCCTHATWCTYPP